MNLTQEGDRLYLYSITTVAILGGLLFGYDTAVISGAEKGLEAFFLTATDFQYDKVIYNLLLNLRQLYANSVPHHRKYKIKAILFRIRSKKYWQSHLLIARPPNRYTLKRILYAPLRYFHFLYKTIPHLYHLRYIILQLSLSIRVLIAPMYVYKTNDRSP